MDEELSGDGGEKGDCDDLLFEKGDDYEVGGEFV